MSLAATPLVGDDRARAVLGHSAGGTAAILASETTAALAEALAPFGLDVRTVDLGRAGGWLTELADLAEESRSAPLVVVAGDLGVGAVALLDLLDRPGDPTAVATLDGGVVDGSAAGFTAVRVQREQRLVHSVGTSRHTVTAPTGYAVGILRIAGQHRAVSAHVWRAAARTMSASDPDVDPFSLALLALVRGGVAVGLVPMGPFDVRRGDTRAIGAPGSPWQQRLRGASRDGDGFFSTMVVRPLSRRLTGFGLAHGWSPNVVTVCSLATGLLASALAAFDSRPAWVAAAVLLQLALVVDCVDGEIARFTRRFSALGAWLDAVGDRVKEYSLIAAVAWVGLRRGESLWLLATVAMVLITLRHLEDYAYDHRTRVSTLHLVPDQLAIDEPRDLGAAGARAFPPTGRSGRHQATYWFRKVMHLPIAERYLLLSVGLLTFDPRVLLWLITVAVAVALAWTQGGRTAKALLRVDGFRPERALSAQRWGHLDLQVDLGPLARLAGRATRLPFFVAVGGAGLVVVGAWSLVTTYDARLAPVLVAVAVLLIGAGCRPPLQHPLGWQAPSVMWGAEAVLVLAVVHSLPDGAQWCGYAYLAAVAWHRYDVVYRLRDTGHAAAPWVTAVTLGVDGRLLVLALLGALGGPVQPVLAWGALLLFAVYAAESAGGWRRWVRSGGRAAPELDGEGEDLG